MEQQPPTDTISGQPADPYKAKNTENDLPVKEKMEGLLALIDRCRWAMMTTHCKESGRLASRCMELAAKVFPPFPLPLSSLTFLLPPPFLSHPSSIPLPFFSCPLFPTPVPYSPWE